MGVERASGAHAAQSVPAKAHRHGDDQMQPVVRQLADLGRKAAAAGSAATLLGIEGMAAKEYFAGFARLLKGGEEFHVEGRNRRPPRDPVNSLLSFVYALLVKEWTIVLHAVGFDPMLGFYHRPRYGRPSLALDLAESFRPLVADEKRLRKVYKTMRGFGDPISIRSSAASCRRRRDRR